MQASSTAETDVVPLQPVLVVLSAILIPILVAAFLLLYVLPHDVGNARFAWPVNPRMSSMMLGATYLGGAYFFLAALLSRQWRHVWLGLLPVTAFAGTLGIATLLHWENFVHERLGFQLWAILYFAVPIILPVLWYRNQRLAREAGGLVQEERLPGVSRWGFGVLGAVLLMAGLLLFFLPGLMAATWPWTLSPLTARVMAAMFILPGLTGLSVAYDGSWTSTFHLFRAQAIAIGLMLIAAYVARGDFNWANPSSWFFIAGLSLVLVLIVYTHLVRE